MELLMMFGTELGNIVLEAMLPVCSSEPETRESCKLSACDWLGWAEVKGTVLVSREIVSEAMVGRVLTLLVTEVKRLDIPLDRCPSDVWVLTLNFKDNVRETEENPLANELVEPPDNTGLDCESVVTSNSDVCGRLGEVTVGRVLTLLGSELMRETDTLDGTEIGRVVEVSVLPEEAVWLFSIDKDVTVANCRREDPWDLVAPAPADLLNEIEAEFGSCVSEVILLDCASELKLGEPVNCDNSELEGFIMLDWPEITEVLGCCEVA